jgi:hypothetical protein
MKTTTAVLAMFLPLFSLSGCADERDDEPFPSDRNPPRFPEGPLDEEPLPESRRALLSPAEADAALDIIVNSMAAQIADNWDIQFQVELNDEDVELQPIAMADALARIRALAAPNGLVDVHAWPDGVLDVNWWDGAMRHRMTFDQRSGIAEAGNRYGEFSVVVTREQGDVFEEDTFFSFFIIDREIVALDFWALATSTL